MAGNNEEGIESILSAFDRIYEDFKDGIAEINSLKSSYNFEIQRRESLEITCNALKKDNERLVKLHSESLNKLANQIERRSKCESLKDELKKLSEQHLRREEEHNIEVDVINREHATKIADMETHVRCFMVQQSANEETIKQLRGDLATHKTHIEVLSRRLEQVNADIESKYHQEVQDLRDWLLVEQEEKRELDMKVQYLENELENSRKKLQEQQRESTANRHVETLKQKIMKLRKENEVYKRQLNNIKDKC